MLYPQPVQRFQASIPSPTVSVIHLGPVPIHIYALCIIAGILVAVWLSDRRWKARGGGENEVGDVAGWAIVFGIVGGRLYHVITDPELYFEKGRHPIDALKIWDGGLGIWGAVILGGVGAYIGCRRHKLNFAAFADVVGPGIIIAQALGRLGNWFNNELYGDATTVPWKLQIHDMNVASGKPQPCSFGAIGQSVCGYYQPTFLYELLWNLVIAALLLWADRRFRLARGQVFAGYVMGYTAGRFVIELLRSDHANRILGLRVNTWVAALAFLGALAFFVIQRHKPRSTARAVTDTGDGTGMADEPRTGDDPGTQGAGDAAARHPDAAAAPVQPDGAASGDPQAPADPVK